MDDLEAPVVIEWSDDTSGRHILRFAWDSSIGEITVTATQIGPDNNRSTVWGLTRADARQVAGLLIRAHSQAESEARGE